MPELTEAYVRSRIADTRNKTAFLFVCFIVILIGGAWAAFESTGPAADIVYVIAVVVGGLGSLIFGVALCSIFGESKRALRDLPHFRNDPEAFERIYDGVLRMRWK